MKITLFYCANSLDQTASVEQRCRKKNIELKTISLPCSGKVNLLYLLKAIETGAEGVILMTCNIGECRYLEGNLRARKRIQAVNDLMVEAGFGSGRLLMIHPGTAQDTDQIFRQILKFTENIGTIIKPDLETARETIQ